jgi:tetratricopeptide (TPR) repeat protein
MWAPMIWSLVILKSLMSAFKSIGKVGEPLCGSLFNGCFSGRSITRLISQLVSHCLGVLIIAANFYFSESVSASPPLKPNIAPAGSLPKVVTTITPSSPDQILERLPPRIGVGTNPRVNSNKLLQQPLNPSASQTTSQTTQFVLTAAAQLIELSRTSGDPRYLGRAQSTLSSFWDSPKAPIRAVILQASIEQSRHEFDAAKRTLMRAISLGTTPTLNPSGERFEQQRTHLAQAWLTLATLERVAGNYPESLKACLQVTGIQVSFYGDACQLETQSHLGEHATAISGLRSMAQQLEQNPSSPNASAANQSWLWSLIGEAYERAGKDVLAAKAYEKSVAIQPDIYTVIAAADLALRQSKNIATNANKAIALLAKVNETDSVLIRKALALKRLIDPQWKLIAGDLAERFNQIKNRGDDPKAHAREQALLEFWLNDNSAQSLRFSLVNLERQREAIDWLVALQAAAKLADQKTILELQNRLKKTKLIDARLEVANV